MDWGMDHPIRPLSAVITARKVLEYGEYGIRIFLTEYDEYGMNTGLSRIRMNTVIRIQNTRTRIPHFWIRDSVFAVFRILKPVFWIRRSVFWVRKTPYSEYETRILNTETRILNTRPVFCIRDPYSEYGDTRILNTKSFSWIRVFVFWIRGFRIPNMEFHINVMIHPVCASYGEDLMINNYWVTKY